MKFPPYIRIFGNTNYRGQCPVENAEQVTFFARVRAMYPDTYGAIAVHIRNEGQRRQGQANWQKAEGMTPGAADIIIPGCPAFVCELKRRDHTKSGWQDGQIEYLQAAQAAGAYVCIALGCDAAMEAFHDWLGR